jgi:hypothetical protein
MKYIAVCSGNKKKYVHTLGEIKDCLNINFVITYKMTTRSEEEEKYYTL